MKKILVVALLAWLAYQFEFYKYIEWQYLFGIVVFFVFAMLGLVVLVRYQNNKAQKMVLQDRPRTQQPVIYQVPSYSYPHPHTGGTQANLAPPVFHNLPANMYELLGG